MWALVADELWMHMLGFGREPRCFGEQWPHPVHVHTVGMSRKRVVVTGEQQVCPGRALCAVVTADALQQDVLRGSLRVKLQGLSGHVVSSC